MSPRKTVMVYDGEADLLYLFRSAPEPAYNFVAAESAKSCIEKFTEVKQKGKKVDVLLDYKLGDMQGDVVACKIHGLNAVKTFLLSAYLLEQTLINNLIGSRWIMAS